MTFTGGQVYAQTLLDNGVKDIFLIPGVQLDWAVEALREHGTAFNLFVPRHEQSTTYMADGYYRVSGRPGIAMVVPGPGLLNATAGLATAYSCHSKVLLLTAKIHSQGAGKSYGLLHELPDQTAVLRSLCTHDFQITAPSAINATLNAAFNTLEQSWGGPIGVEIPHDYLESTAGVQDKHAPAPEPAIPELDSQALQEAARLLNEATLPVIYAGGGTLSGKAHQQLLQVAEKLNTAVVISDNARGVIDDRHPLAMTTLSGRAIFAKADVALVVGSRFVDNVIPKPVWPQDKIKFIYLNIDSQDFGAPRIPTVALHTDAATGLAALNEYLKPRTVLSTEQTQAAKDWAQEQIRATSPLGDYLHALRQGLPEDGIFVNELTQVGYMARYAFPVYQPGSYIGPGYQGTLGYGFPTALGAAVAGGGRRVLSITGDGGFGWNLQELATAARYQLPVTLVVFNDGYYGNVRAIQKRVFGHEVAVALRNPDFQQLAQSFGVAATQVSDPKALEGAIQSANSHAGPVLIEVQVGTMPSPWPLMGLKPMPGVDIGHPPANLL